MIETDDQMLLAQKCVGNLRSILLEARKVHWRRDYMRLAEPILVEIQARGHEICNGPQNLGTKKAFC